MKLPENISRVTVELETGQWVSFTREDLIAVEDFTSVMRFWELLAFIAGLCPMPDLSAEIDIAAMGAPCEAQR